MRINSLNSQNQSFKGTAYIKTQHAPWHLMGKTDNIFEGFKRLDGGKKIRGYHSVIDFGLTKKPTAEEMQFVRSLARGGDVLDLHHIKNSQAEKSLPNRIKRIIADIRND